MKRIYISIRFLVLSQAFLVCSLLSPLVYSSDISSSVKASIEAKYKQKIVFINQSLKKNQQEFTESPLLLAQYVDNNVLPLWNAEKTLRGLLGSKNWKEISETNQSELVSGFDNTIQRYVQEGFSLYDGQVLEFVDLKLNKKQNRGLLTLKVIPNLLPEFNVNFKIAKEEDGWQLYDILVQGVSYIKLKKDSFRKQHINQGITAVIEGINVKNKGYIKSQNRAFRSEERGASSELKD